jgi:heptosyltransferase-2
VRGAKCGPIMERSAHDSVAPASRSSSAPALAKKSGRNTYYPAPQQLLGTDLGVYAAVLAESRAVIANDTGPGHLAAAVGARLVAIYGPHSVMAWAPLGERVDIYTSPQGWPSLETIEASLLKS